MPLLAIVYGEFVEQEDTTTYLSVLSRYLQQCGRPLAFYTDKHAVFSNNSKNSESKKPRSHG